VAMNFRILGSLSVAVLFCSLTLSGQPFVRFAPNHFSEPALSAIDIRDRALKALDENASKYSNILYSRHGRGQFEGREHCDIICLDDPKPLYGNSPWLLSHTEIVNGKLALLLDGWDDQPPLHFKDIRERTNFGTNSYSTEEMTREFLSPRRSLELIGQKTVEGRGKVYVLGSRPIKMKGAVPKGFPKCAVGMTASILIDAEDFFPVSVSARVASATGGCHEGQDVVFAESAEWVWGYTLVTGKDPCGTTHEIYAPWYTLATGKLSALVSGGGVFGGGSVFVRMAPGSVAHRMFKLNIGFAGGKAQAFSESFNFRIFVTGACMRPDPVEFVESVKSTIRYDDTQD